MRKIFVAIAAGATIAATPALAQDQGRGGMRDQTRAEAQQRADAMFHMFDSNGDGAVTRAEADQAVTRFEMARGDEGGRGSGRMERMVADVFGTSTSLTLAQFEAKALARFDAADLNHDGLVTAAERQQARAAQAAQAAQVPARPQ